MALALRDYQVRAVEAVAAARGRGMRRPAFVLPTGAGKTLVIAELAKRERAARPGSRCLVIAHRAELIEQARDKIRMAMPGQPVGVVKAERNETLAPVVVASVQTLASERRRRMLRDVGLIIVDECHHATARSYLEILDHFGAMAPDGPGGCWAVGCTATMVRGDGAALGDVWQDVVAVESISDMIESGWLVRPRGRRVWVEGLDLSGVRKRAGDFDQRELGAAMERSMAPAAAAKAYAEHASDRQGMLFWPTVEVAGMVAEQMRGVGISCELVHGGMPLAARERVYADARAERVQALSNCMVLTEGFDLPQLSVCVVGRPTTHRGLYVQMVGRVLRPWPGKDGALVLDVTGASERHALANSVELIGERVGADVDREAGDVDDALEFRLDDDEALASALGLGRPAAVGADGPLASAEVDLFHGSESAWLRTRGGVWFLGAGERYIAIVPSATRAGAWDVTAMHRYQRGTGRWVALAVPDLAWAMAHAEGEVTPAELTTARRERSWRAKPVSQAQQSLAARLYVSVDGLTSGEASNAISRAMASSRIDPIVASAMSRGLS